ncbi:hypothetical protein [Streptomyces sp. HUAS TT20]|uniref:hypothetical protein n=1 Tax=Streptomyces sp. HUAS TT20 TaxID=3447509 RepID=UPI0021D81885|nr:hypothetical protein [Streptomyces sp. HUAS 15-9]UXY28557.1 hypothetical protein N8I87_19660 [Streptomyces sp. HUAS 15-9]
MTETTAAPSTQLGALPPAAVNLLAALVEALDIPHPACMGGQAEHDRILNERVMYARLALRSVLAGNTLGIEWDTNYLRERLAEHPPTTYVTHEQAQAALAEGKTWTEAVTLPAEDDR